MRLLHGYDVVNLTTEFDQEEIDFGRPKRPNIEIKSDGDYEIFTSKYSSSDLISTQKASGDNVIVWEYTSPISIRYLLIRLLSGTYLEARISTNTKNS